jgi:hypothetical protein
MTLTDEERDERLLTPWERHQRDLEALRKASNRYGGWVNADQQRQHDERQRQYAERERVAVEARKKRDAEHRAEQARKAHEAGVADLAAYEERARAAWLSAGGDAEGWRSNWPKLRDGYLRERAQERLTRDERRVAELVAKGRATGGFGRL